MRSGLMNPRLQHALRDDAGAGEALSPSDNETTQPKNTGPVLSEDAQREEWITKFRGKSGVWENAGIQEFLRHVPSKDLKRLWGQNEIKPQETESFITKKFLLWQQSDEGRVALQKSALQAIPVRTTPYTHSSLREEQERKGFAIAASWRNPRLFENSPSLAAFLSQYNPTELDELRQRSDKMSADREIASKFLEWYESPEGKHALERIRPHRETTRPIPAARPQTSPMTPDNLVPVHAPEKTFSPEHNVSTEALVPVSNKKAEVPVVTDVKIHLPEPEGFTDQDARQALIRRLNSDWKDPEIRAFLSRIKPGQLLQLPIHDDAKANQIINRKFAAWKATPDGQRMLAERLTAEKIQAFAKQVDHSLQQQETRRTAVQERINQHLTQQSAPETKKESVFSDIFTGLKNWFKIDRGKIAENLASLVPSRQTQIQAGAGIASLAVSFGLTTLGQRYIDKITTHRQAPASATVTFNIPIPATGKQPASAPLVALAPAAKPRPASKPVTVQLHGPGSAPSKSPAKLKTAKILDESNEWTAYNAALRRTPNTVHCQQTQIESGEFIRGCYPANAVFDKNTRVKFTSTYFNASFNASASSDKFNVLIEANGQLQANGQPLNLILDDRMPGINKVLVANHAVKLEEEAARLAAEQQQAKEPETLTATL